MGKTVENHIKHMDVQSSMLPDLFRITRIKRETHDTFTLDLEPANGSGDFRFQPGQFNMLYRFGVGEIPISISGDPVHFQRLTHTIRSVGSVSQSLVIRDKGDVIGIRGPYGHPWPMEDVKGKDLVIISGGIGLAPLRPVMYHIMDQRDNYGNISLLYGARSPNDILYSKELERWRGRFDLDVFITVDTAGRDWRGRVGVVTSLIPRIELDPSKTVAMICGPEVMMRFTIRDLLHQGLTAKDIFISMERNMHCAVGFCGHCQLGSTFICKDGPIFRFDKLEPVFGKKEL